MTSGQTSVNVEAGNGAPAANNPSFVKKMQEAKKNSRNRCDFFQTFCIILSDTAGCTIGLAILLILPIVMVVLGAVYKNECPSEPCLPYWMIVWGVLSGVRKFIALGISRLKADTQKKNHWIKFVHVLDFILFAGFIAGSYFVYHIYKPHFENKYADNYCHEGTYLFVFWIITISYAMLALIIFAVCCGCIVMAND